jgi:hypothetical protein
MWPRWLSAALRLSVAKVGSRQSGRERKKRGLERARWAEMGGKESDGLKETVMAMMGWKVGVEVWLS